MPWSIAQLQVYKKYYLSWAQSSYLPRKPPCLYRPLCPPRSPRIPGADTVRTGSRHLEPQALTGSCHVILVSCFSVLSERKSDRRASGQLTLHVFVTCGSLIVRLVVLLPTTPNMTTSLVRTLTERFAVAFCAILALIGAFRVFSTTKIFFLGIVPTNFA